MSSRPPITADELHRLRDLAEGHSEPWVDDENGHSCPCCNTTLYLSPEMEPRGLCDFCVDKLIDAVPALIDLAALGLNVDPVLAASNALTAERDAYRAMVCDLLASAVPNQRDHPTMTKQWARARELLKNGPSPAPQRTVRGVAADPTTDPAWHTRHLQTCGTAYRGCDPQCPKDLAEKACKP